MCIRNLHRTLHDYMSPPLRSICLCASVAWGMGMSPAYLTVIREGQRLASLSVGLILGARLAVGRNSSGGLERLLLVTNEPLR